MVWHGLQRITYRSYVFPDLRDLKDDYQRPTLLLIAAVKPPAS